MRRLHAIVAAITLTEPAMFDLDRSDYLAIAFFIVAGVAAVYVAFFT